MKKSEEDAIFDEIAESIMEAESRTVTIAEELRGLKKEFRDALERDMIHFVQQNTADFRVAAVDGGLLAEELHGFDLVLSRTVGVFYEYDEGRLAKYDYYPEPQPPVKMSALSGLDAHEFAWHKSLVRMQGEIGLAREMVEKFKPDYMLLDGSIVPQIADKPSEDSVVRPLYNDLVSMCISLYESAHENGCKLIGVIKDSRGRRFIEMLGEAGIQTMRMGDTSLLTFMLRKGERTFAFYYSKQASEHNVLMDLGDWGKRVKAMYVKPVEIDRPLRVEFICDDFPEIASVIYTLSCINRNYGYPAILIEADMRAALDRIELERAYRSILSRVGPRASIMKLRRNMRPFR